MKKIFQYILMTVSLVATASCSNELDDTLQPANNGNLQFVVSDFPAFGEGTQTRAIGTPDSGKTAWEAGDNITVTFTSSKYGEQTATLTYDGSAWTSTINFMCLENEMPTVTAVYNPSATPGLGEYLTTTDYTIADNTLNISFANATRTYSRLRLVAAPNTSLTITVTGFTKPGRSEAGDQLYTLTTDDNGNAYLYGTFAAGATVSILFTEDFKTILVEHTFTEATEAGKSYALFAGVTVDLSTLTGTYVINDSEWYRFTGTGSYGIKVESGNPRIILGDVNINVSSGNVIDITADNSGTTIHVQGTNNVTSDNGAGIYVAEGSTVTITGNARDDKLTVKAGGDAAAIGGYATGTNSYQNCGAINIIDITVEAYGGIDNTCPGIGSVGDASSQTITIDNAVVYAFGTTIGAVQATPGIGCGYPMAGSPNSIPTIVIKNNSIIHAYRGDTFTDYIGWAGDIGGFTAAESAINCGTGGSIISSTVYCYTGAEATSPDKTVTYDANGTATEIPAE